MTTYVAIFKEVIIIKNYEQIIQDYINKKIRKEIGKRISKSKRKDNEKK